MTEKTTKAVRKKTVKNKSRRKQTKRGGSNVLIYAFLITVIIATAIILSLTVFFKASAITVINKSGRYNNEQIIAASGLSIGNNLILTDTTQAQSKIEAQLPYLKNVTITKKFPSTFEISVKEVKPNRIYSVNGKYALAYGEKVLEIVDDYQSEYTLYNIPIKQAKAGNNVVIDPESNELYKILNEEISNSKLENITVVKFSSSVDIKLVYDNRLLLDIGTTENLKEKLKNAVEVIGSVTTKHGEYAEGTINLKYLVDKNNESYFTMEPIQQYKIIPESKNTDNN